MKLKSLPLRYRVLLFLTLALVTAIGLFYAVENWRGARAWAAVEAKLKAAGAPMTMDEIVPPMPPEDQNFAMIPIFKESLSFDSARGWVGVNTNSELHAITKGVGSPWGRRNYPWATLRSIDTKAVFGDFLERQDLEATSESGGVPAERVLSHFAQWSDLLAQIESGVQRPHSQFPLRYEDNFGALLPHLSPIRQLVRVFTIEALAHLELGNSEAAANKVKVALQLANSLHEEPLLISGLVQIAGLDTALQPLWQGLNERTWSREQLVSFQRELARTDFLAQLNNAFHTDRVFTQNFIDSVLQSDDRTELAEVFGDFTSPYSPVSSKTLVRIAPTGWLLQNKALASELFFEHAGEIVDSERRVILPRNVHRIEEQVDRATSKEGIYNRWARKVIPAFSRAANRFAFGQATVNLAQIACALERYRLDHPTYPASLNELRPDYLADVPHDIFNGEPLNYQREGDRYVLWSVGWNETDDGGTVVLNKSGQQVEPDQGDIVWRYPGPDTAESSPTPTR